MKTLLWMLLAVLSVSVMQAQSASPSTVLVLVNDAYLPETGTNGVGASVYVGEHYAQMRNIPSGNILHLDIPYAGYQSDGQWHGMEYDANQFLSYPDYLLYIQTPVQQFLSENPQILYIVTTYGVPSMLADTVWRLSIDSLLVAMYSGVAPMTSPSVANPYQDASATGNPPHFADWVNPAGYRMCLVTRLDAPSAVIAAGLVDKAIEAEETLTKSTGTAYFDWRNLSASDTGYYPTDQTVLNAYNEAVSLGIPATLNNQAVTENTIQSAPNSAWAWGWYQVIITDAYSSPISGSIASQATSYTCNSIRDGGTVGTDSNWCAYFLNTGVTATWGATGEPYAQGIATGNSLFGHFWRGYNFAESAYLANPYNNWMMTFIGDPLYAPPAFAASARRPCGGFFPKTRKAYSPCR